MKIASSTAIDKAGRIVIPKEIRRRAGLSGGTPVEVRFRDGRIEIEPLPRRVRLVKRGKMTVAVPLEPSEPLTNEIVTKTLEALRDGED